MERGEIVPFCARSDVYGRACDVVAGWYILPDGRGCGLVGIVSALGAG